MRPSLPRVVSKITLLIACGLAMPGGRSVAGPAESPVDYNQEVRPLLSKHCFACHGQDEEHRAKGLRLDRRDSATRELPDGALAILPGDPEASDLYLRITDEDESLRMPPRKEGPRLSAAEVDVLRRWIAQGASYSEHWAFVPPADRPLPAVKDRAWPRGGIDRWILERLEREGVRPSPEADREVLLRRVSLDLRGLPPSPEEVEAFARDRSPDAYEKAVDRFLESPAYGERWARVWLDLARYADSAGYGSDPLRPNMYRYRDWVIDAFNRNLPYDEFTVEQVAGDLLPNPDRSQLIATAFNRNTMTNTEGGTDDEEFRSAAIKDRVDTTSQVWMGLTIGCAKCHTHKYDPITQDEYYGLYAIFNQSADADLPTEAPVIPAPTPEMEAKLRAIDGRIAALRAELDTPTPALASAQAKWEASLGEPPDWAVLATTSARSEGGATLEVLPDGSVRAGGANPDGDTAVISARADLDGITAFRLEAIPDPSLPAGGSGRGDAGAFVLSHLEAEVVPDDEAAKPLGRYVRVELPGEEKILSLAEVEVYSEGENLAPGGAATQSSTDYDGPAARAIDGNTDGRFSLAKSTTHTRKGRDPWWEVALAEPAAIDRITVWNRVDRGVDDRLAGFRVQILDDDRKVVWQADVAEPPRPDRRLTTDGRRDLAFSLARADFSGKGYDLAGLIDGEAKPGVKAGAKPRAKLKPGWSVAPRQAERHEAIFVLGEPLHVTAPGARSQGEETPSASPSPSPLVGEGRGGGDAESPTGKGARTSHTTPHPNPPPRGGREEDGALSPPPAPVRLTFRLEQRSGMKGANLGRFRLAATTAGAVARWAEVPPAILAILDVPEAERTPEQREELARHYRSIARELKPVRDEIARLEKSRPMIPNLPVMEELPAEKRRETRLMNKGNFLDPGHVVEPGVPAAFHPLPEGAARDRLGLARWLVAQDNPLTARVAVNRFWGQLFGTGLVETEEDFGTQGEPPSHPELLDWLAREFVASGWDVKALIRSIVTSATYRQSSKARPELMVKDPKNRLLARAPRYRLEAEMVRDQALALSGLLSREVGGPSVFPPQPEGLWQAAFNGQRTWSTSQGDDRYRRGLYIFWRRTIPYPSMATFDAPSRELCTMRRVRTNTPLQAFVTLNDPVYVEAAQALARRIVREGGLTPGDRIRYALRLCTCRTPESGQVEVLKDLFTRERERYSKDLEAARALATEPLGPLPEGMEPAEMAAWTAVANVLLNLDGVLTRG